MLETTILTPRFVSVITDRPERLICALINAGRPSWPDMRIGALQPMELLARYSAWCLGSLAPDGRRPDNWRSGIIDPDFLEHIGLDISIEDCGDRYVLEVSRYNDRLNDPQGAERAVAYFLEDGGWDTRSIAASRQPPLSEEEERSLRRFALGVGIPTSGLSGAALYAEFAELFDLEVAFLLPLRGTSFAALAFMIGIVMTLGGLLPMRRSPTA